jgi:maleylpyruvate isomerase
MNHQITQSLARISAATGRLGAAAGGLTAEQAAAPSLLPGWTRGHVLTHVARNADGLANLLRWARTGARTPMYASREARAADLEAGAGRPAGELAADVRDSAAAFAAEAARLPDGAWTATVESLTSGPIPASEVLVMRLSEVEIHHVDLGAGYSCQDWPDDFVGGALSRVAESFGGRDDTPPCRVQAAGSPAYLLGPAGAGGTVPEISGSAQDALAWLLGRGTGQGLTVRPAGTLPVLPAWR